MQSGYFVHGGWTCWMEQSDAPPQGGNLASTAVATADRSSMTIPQWAFLSLETMNHVDQHDDGVMFSVDDDVVAMGGSNDDNNKYLDSVVLTEICPS